EVRHRAQAAQDHARALLLEELHQQAVEAGDFDIGKGGDRRARDVDPLVEREDRILAAAARDRDDDAVEQHRRASYEVVVAAGERVERARVNRYRFLHAWLLRIRWKWTCPARPRFTVCQSPRCSTAASAST